MVRANNLSELININNEFKNAINLYLNLNDEEKILSYIPTKSSINMLNGYLKSIINKNNNASILVGPYGKGKSHLLLLVLAIASLERNKKNELIINKLKKRIQDVDSEETDIIFNINSVWRQKRFLPVIIMSSYNDLNQAFLMALNDALKREGLLNITPNTYFSIAKERINEWKSLYPETYKKFKELLKDKGTTIQNIWMGLEKYERKSLDLFSTIYPQLTSGSKFNPLAEMEVLPLYKIICDKICSDYDFSGMYILFDEFSKFIESQDKQMTGNNMKLLQDMCELSSNSSDNSIFITMVAHKSIKEYGKYLSNDTINAFTGIEGRLVENLFVTSSKNNYELIKHAIIKNKNCINPYEDRYLSEKVVDKYYKVPYFNGTFKKNDFRKIIVEGCYPLNAISAYLLMNISEKVAQNERTLFTFISKDEPNSMAHYINVHTKDKPWIINANLIYDYFSGLFKKDINNENVHTQWLNAEYAISRCKSEEEKNMIKALAIILIVNKPDEIPSTSLYVQYAANEDNIDIIENLLKRKIIYKKASTNCIMFKTRAGSDLRKEIKKRLSLYDNINVSNLLNKISGSNYIIPIKYNNDYYMTRYFKHIYMDVNDYINIMDMSVVFDEIGFCDGCILSLYSNKDGISYNSIKNKVKELHSLNTIVEFTSIFYKCERELREYAVLEDIANDKSYLIENEVVIKEIPLLEEDLSMVINTNLETMYMDNKNIFLYYSNDELKELRGVTREQVVDNVCFDLYNLTPIINNEFVNRRRIITSQTKRSRKAIIDAIINKNDDISFYSGNGQEASIYRSLFIVTKLKDNDEDQKLKNIIDIIENFINKSIDEKQSIKLLVDELLARPYAIREAIIPFYFAYVISRRKEDIILYFESMEVEINADRLIDMFDNPQDFMIYVSRKEIEKEQYLEKIQELFDIPKYKVTHDNRISITAEYIRRWYRGLPQISRNISKQTNYILDTVVNKQIIRLKKLLQRMDYNPYEMLFMEIPSIFESKSSNDTYKKLKAIKRLFDNYFEWNVKCVINLIKEYINPNSKESLYHIIKEWYENQSEYLKQGLFEGRITQLMSCIRDINTYDENVIAGKIAKAVTDVYIEDWNEDSVIKFSDSLKEILLKISQIKQETIIRNNKNKLQFIGKNNKKVECFYEPVGEDKGVVFRNIIEDTIEQFEDDLSVNDRVAILLEMIEKIMK